MEKSRNYLTLPDVVGLTVVVGGGGDGGEACRFWRSALQAKLLIPSWLLRSL